MYKFNIKSLTQLETCHTDLIILFYEVIKYFDCSVLEGHRNKTRQNILYLKFSRVIWPNSKHNKIVSEAIDVAPYPYEKDNINRFIYFAGFVLGIAKMLNINIRWGGDWNSNNKLSDNKFNDLAHFELIKNKDLLI